MQVQKLVYFAHGWHLAIKGAPLINEQVEAWSFGPVIPSLYQEFRSYGNQPVTQPITYYLTCWPPGMENLDAEDFEVRPFVPAIEDDPIKAIEVKPLLDRIWDLYSVYSGTQLSNMTHSSNSPWTLVYNRYSGAIPKHTDIPTESIRDYFVGLAESKAKSAATR